jgi:methionyl-tRNA synthetase
VNRTLSMANRYLGGDLPPLGTEADADRELRGRAERAVATYRAAMERLHFHEALGAVTDLTDAANGYAESQAPWTLNKAGETERLGQVLATLAEGCRLLGHLVAPVMPSASRALLGQLNAPVPYDVRGAGGPGVDALLAWGSGPEPWRVRAPTPLFPRIEPAEVAP